MKIYINEPCHENWDKMAPNQQGAFCGSCQKTVIDFSKKTIGEIKDFFQQKPKEQSVCGRFRQNQFREMEFDEFINEFMSWKFLKRAAVVCFLVIGTTFFSSCSDAHTKGEVEHTAGVVAYNDSLTQKTVTDTVKQANDSLSVLQKNDTLNAAKCVKTKKKKKTETVPEPPMVVGEISEP